jgi:hypothetical protein
VLRELVLDFIRRHEGMFTVMALEQVAVRWRKPPLRGDIKRAVLALRDEGKCRVDEKWNVKRV